MHCIDHLEQESRTVLNCSAILVRAAIRLRTQELMDEISVGAMQFDTIKACLVCTHRGVFKIRDRLLHVFKRGCLWHRCLPVAAIDES